jgi:hypothetical protein
MKTLRLLACLAFFAAALALLVACGDNPTPTPPPPTPTATPIPPSPTPAAGGSAITGGAAGSPASASDIALINDAITKTTNVDSYHYSIRLSVPGMVENTQIDGDYQSPDKAHLTVNAGGQRQEIINIGSTSYVKQADGSWLSQDLGAAAAGAGAGGAAAGLGGLSSMAGGLDPTRASNIFGTLGRFAAGVNAANIVGPDTVNGKSVTRYNVPLYLGNLMGTGGSTTPGETPIGYADVWIDPSTQLVHRLTAKLDLTDLIRGFAAFMPTVGPDQPSPTPFPPIVIDADMQLSAFGQAVDISAPAGAKPAPTMAP